jgi:signal transduction histidine kinase
VLILAQIRDLAESSLQSARDILATLRPRLRVTAGLADSVRRHTEDFARIYHLTASLSLFGDDHEVSSEEQDTMFQILREALTNVRKHAQATRVEVTLDLRHRPFSLVVEDDGVGLDPARVNTSSGSFGIVGMRERAQPLGAWVELGPRARGGTRLVYHGSVNGESRGSAH